MHYYPISLRLEDRRCVVIGGGVLAEAKVAGLVEAGARVTLIASGMTDKLAVLCRDTGVTVLRRDYREGDLAGAFLVISTHEDPAVNDRIWQEANTSGILINTVDDVPHCNFIAPSIMRQGDLSFAISTAGKAPALAVRLRQRLEETYGPEYARFLELAGRIRAPLSERYPDFSTRRALWYALIDSDVIDLLRNGEEARAHRRMQEIMGVGMDESANGQMKKD